MHAVKSNEASLVLQRFKASQLYFEKGCPGALVHTQIERNCKLSKLKEEYKNLSALERIEWDLKFNIFKPNTVFLSTRYSGTVNLYFIYKTS